MMLATKAAGGASAPPAQAMAFGRAALCHLIAQRPMADLTEALGGLPQGPIMQFPSAFIRLTETTTTTPSSTGQIDVPEFSSLALSYAQALPFKTTARLAGATLTLDLDVDTPNQIPAVSRVTLPDEIYRHWQSLAARLLVPESEASRLSGAGAGLTDND
jgi:hypothetical protein